MVFFSLGYFSLDFVYRKQTCLLAVEIRRIGLIKGGRMGQKGGGGGGVDVFQLPAQRGKFELRYRIFTNRWLGTISRGKHADDMFN